MKPQLTKIWLSDFEGRQDIRVDFSNDRHYAALVEMPRGAEQVAQALFLLADMITHDPHLTPNAKNQGLPSAAPLD